MGQTQIAPASRRWRRAAATVLTALALCGAPSAANAEPALWRLRDADSVVYLFGTFHIVKPEADWLAPRTKEALEESEEIWLEVDLLGQSAALVMAMTTLGTSPGTPLSSRLSPEELERLRAAADRAGIPFQTLEPLRPWLAAVTLMQRTIRAFGFSEAGPDLQFALYGQQTETPVYGFETAAEQLGYFAALPPESELALLRSAVEDADEGRALLERMYAAWMEGDIDTLDAEVLSQMRELGPEVFRTLVENRNRRFAEGVRALMARSGTQFVAVGAAHLIGDVSVQAILAEEGIDAERLDLGLKR